MRGKIEGRESQSHKGERGGTERAAERANREHGKRDMSQYLQGKCAFGPDCRKMHDPRMLSDSALSALREQDADLRQQLTLHLASIPEGVTEQDILEVGACA